MSLPKRPFSFWDHDTVKILCGSSVALAWLPGFIAILTGFKRKWGVKVMV